MLVVGSGVPDMTRTCVYTWWTPHCLCIHSILSLPTTLPACISSSCLCMAGSVGRHLGFTGMPFHPWQSVQVSAIHGTLPQTKIWQACACFMLCHGQDSLKTFSHFPCALYAGCFMPVPGALHCFSAGWANSGMAAWARTSPYCPLPKTAL